MSNLYQGRPQGEGEASPPAAGAPDTNKIVKEYIKSQGNGVAE